MPEAALARLEAYSPRLRRSAIHAMALHEAWSTMNDLGDRRHTLARSPASPAAGVIQDALLRELIIVLVRVLDRPRGDVQRSDKVSFPACLGLLERPGVLALRLEEGRQWHGGDRADENAQALAGAASSLCARLERLAAEEPNRERRLRDFRDEFLAHELDLPAQRGRPEYGDLRTMTDELVGLSADLSIAVEGARVAWPRGELATSSTALWAPVLEAYGARTARPEQ